MQLQRFINIFSKHSALGIQFIKYIFVGGVAFLFDFGTLYFLTDSLGLHYLISAAFAFIVGLNVNYFLAKYLVFKNSKIKDIKTEYSLIVFISFTALLFNQFFLWFFTSIFGLYYLYSKVIAVGLILIYNFIIRKIFIFE